MTKGALPNAELRYVEAPDGTRLALHLLGSGPPLLCVPGGPGRAAAYFEDLGGLAATRRLLLLDNRGTGRSDLPEDRSSLAFPSLAEDVETVIATLDAGPVDVLGHSAGSLVAAVHAARHPASVRRLVLATPSARWIADTDDDVRQIRESRSGEPWYADVVALEKELQRLPPHERDRADGGLRPYYYGVWDDRTQAHAATTDSQMSRKATANFMPDDVTQLPSPDLLADISAPTLVVVGSRDGLTGTRAGELIAARIPDARVAQIEGAGHYPWVEAPGRFRDVVEQHLRRADA